MNFGVPIDCDEFDEPFGEMLRQLVSDGKSAYDSLRPNMKHPWDAHSFEIIITDRPDLYAATVCDENTYYIYIYRGTIEHIFGTMLGLFSCPAFLPDVGNASVETRPIIGSAGFPMMPLLRKNASVPEDVNVSLPMDPARCTLAQLLGDIALHFLICHEIGHIVAGHHELLASLGMNLAISEIHGYIPSEYSSLRQILECDADAFACHLTGLVHTDKSMEDTVSQLAQAPSWTPEQCTHVTWLAAVSVLFRVLMKDAHIGEYATHSTHPHPAVRALIVGSSMLARSLESQSLDEESAQPIMDFMFSRSVRNVEDVWAEMSLPGQLPGSPISWAARVQNAAHTLFLAYDASRSRLEEFAHLPRRWHDWEWRPPAEDN